MNTTMPRQDSTKDQLSSIVEACTDQPALMWMDCWQSEYLRPITRVSFNHLMDLCRTLKCYDAQDAITMRVGVHPTIPTHPSTIIG